MGSHIACDCGCGHFFGGCRAGIVGVVSEHVLKFLYLLPSPRTGGEMSASVSKLLLMRVRICATIDNHGQDSDA